MVKAETVLRRGSQAVTSSVTEGTYHAGTVLSREGLEPHIGGFRACTQEGSTLHQCG